MISKDEVKNIAKLSRLKFTDQELTEFQTTLSQIVGYMDKLNELNTDGIEPSFIEPIEFNQLREDTSKPSADRDELLKNAPDSDSGAFKVPTVVK